MMRDHGQNAHPVIISAIAPTKTAYPELIAGFLWLDTTVPALKRCTDPDAPTYVNVETALGAPSNVDYLVGTADANLSAEIVVGTSPGGELGGTWAAPTIDATHSGSSHANLPAGAQVNSVDIVTVSGIQTLTNKTLTSPTINGFIDFTTNGQGIQWTNGNVVITGDNSLGTITLAVDGGSTNALLFNTGAVEKLRIGASKVVFNEDSADMDFRIESNNNSNAFVIDGGTDSVAFGAGVEAGAAITLIGYTNARTLANQVGMGVFMPNGTWTDNGGARTVGVGAIFFMGTPTFTNATNAVTITDAATLFIGGAPVAGTNMAITESWSFYVNGDSSYFGGNVKFNSTITAGADGVGASGEQLTSGGAGAEVSWTAAASRREYKDVLGVLDPSEALDAVLSTTAYRFKYKKDTGHGTGDHETLYAGVMADEAPWAMHYGGEILNPINTFGYTLAAIKALKAEIDDLKRR